MGQAVADLPDPLSAAPVSSASTDDLLAQLAGEEIERLLAEADEQPASSKPAVVTPSAISQASPAQNTGAATHASISKPPVNAPTHVDAPFPKATQSNPSPDAELSTLFLEIENASPATAFGQSAPINVQASELDSAPSAADALAQEMLEDAATSPSGRAAFSPTTTASAASHAPAAFHEDSTNESVPFFFRILDWVNRPLDPYPDHVRELVGKIAIVTTVNAAAVLAYVLIFRGH